MYAHGTWILFLDGCSLNHVCCVPLPGTNIQTRHEVAIKLECVKTKHPQLHIEAKFYKMMQSGGVCRSVSAFVLSQGFMFHTGGGGTGIPPQQTIVALCINMTLLQGRSREI